jgi:intracellular sulfur oxidation DsrE/DsrF family protein
MSGFKLDAGRRAAMRWIGGASLTVTALGSQNYADARPKSALATEELTSGEGTKLLGFQKKLAELPRQRDFQTVPFVLTHNSQWDSVAANEILSYRYPARQVWECTEFAGPWLNLMRESMNGQVFSHGHRDFLAVSATHGMAHVALFNESMWLKYDLGSLVGEHTGNKNIHILERPGVSQADEIQLVDGFYGAGNNNITSLQRRGAVFVACHDSIHGIARNLRAKLELSADANQIAADLTNNLIPDAVLVPSAVAFLVELQRRGYTYAKGS